MTVHRDGSPKRLWQQSPPSASPLPAALQPLGGASPEAVRVMVQALVQEQLAAECAAFLGVAPYARDAARGGVRNGTRPRTLVTRVGALALRVPRDRASLFRPAVFQRYARHEQALIAVLAECDRQGVSTRKVRQVVETLCGETVSVSLVSKATKQLDASLHAWRARRLDAQAMPYLIVDAHYERIRREGQVLSTAILWVIGVRADGESASARTVLAIGEAKVGEQLSRAHVARLELARQALGPRAAEAKLLLFGRTFSDGLRAAADARGDLELVSLGRLYGDGEGV